MSTVLYLHSTVFAEWFLEVESTESRYSISTYSNRCVLYSSYYCNTLYCTAQYYCCITILTEKENIISGFVVSFISYII